MRGTENRLVATQDQTSDTVTVERETVDGRKRYRTQRAAAQFKSPLSADVSLKVMSSVRLTPTIQVQERKLQILKRAVKVKRDGDEEILEALVRKWTEAGREVAWEVWDLVKDNRSSVDSSKSKRSSDDGWGWSEKPSQIFMSGEERNWGWDVVPKVRADDEEADVTKNHKCATTEYEDDEKRQATLGTMLMQLGIAPETLGWNEEEESFEGE